MGMLHTSYISSSTSPTLYTAPGLYSSKVHMHLFVYTIYSTGTCIHACNSERERGACLYCCGVCRHLVHLYVQSFISFNAAPPPRASLTLTRLLVLLLRVGLSVGVLQIVRFRAVFHSEKSDTKKKHSYANAAAAASSSSSSGVFCVVSLSHCETAQLLH